MFVTARSSGDTIVGAAVRFSARIAAPASSFCRQSLATRHHNAPVARATCTHSPPLVVCRSACVGNLPCALRTNRQHSTVDYTKKYDTFGPEDAPVRHFLPFQFAQSVGALLAGPSRSLVRVTIAQQLVVLLH